jgi:hypothetical protein
MGIAATLCGLAAAGCAGSGPAPVEFTCNAAQSWQNTGILVHAGDRLTILYENGQWTADIRAGLAPPAGNPRTPGRTNDVVPAAYHSALIGRVGDQLFIIGNALDTVATVDGRLYCVINTDISAADARPFLAADGQVTMRALVIPARPACGVDNIRACL